MHDLREEHRVGLDYLEAVTLLLQRIRDAHPTAGLYEAADFQWWWGQQSRPTDTVAQLFWLDHLGRPEAAVIVTESADRVQLDPLLMPDASPDLVAHVMNRGLHPAGELGIEAVSLEVDSADDVLLEVLRGHGFTVQEDVVVEAWLAAGARPNVSPLPKGYRLARRSETASRPHHMMSTKRGHPDPEQRLQQTSLYRPELDLVVLDGSENAASYGLFWYDPTTATGLVEPLRTEDDHQRRGLARHVLTAGLELLAAAGAERIKIVYDPDNPASGKLYRSVGFEPDRQTVVLSGRPQASAVAG